MEKGDILPSDDYVMRHVSWNKLLKDPKDDETVIGFRPEAFEPRPSDDCEVSVNWVEYYRNSKDSTDDIDKYIREAISAIKGSRSVKKNSRFAVVCVHEIKKAADNNSNDIEVIYKPYEKNPSHAVISPLSKDCDAVISAIAFKSKVFSPF